MLGVGAYPDGRVNTLDFPEADEFLRYALPAAKKIAALKRWARRAGVPVVSANDNFGRWRSDLAAVVKRCLEPGCKGRSRRQNAAFPASNSRGLESAVALHPFPRYRPSPGQPGGR